MGKAKVKPTLRWEDAPDTICPEELSKILGVGIVKAQDIFNLPGFPKIEKTFKADKESARLFIQGFKIREKPKEALLYMIYQEMLKMNQTKEEEKKCVS